MYHPRRKKKLQLFRREIEIAQAEEIFKNPRVHTGLGYHERHQLERNMARYTKMRQSAQLIGVDDEEGDEIEDIPILREITEEISSGEGRKRSRELEKDGCDDEDDYPNLKRRRISCIYGASCVKENCEYEHRCRYGKTYCQRTDCKFTHYETDDDWWYAKECEYGSACTYPGCKFKHGNGSLGGVKKIAYQFVRCRFDGHCQRLGCWYNHYFSQQS